MSEEYENSIPTPERLRLVEALVGPHRDLYRHNAHFYHGLNQFAAMLPAMIDGLAQSAVVSQAETDELKAQLERAPMPPPPFIDDHPYEGSPNGKFCNYDRGGEIVDLCSMPESVHRERYR